MRMFSFAYDGEASLGSARAKLADTAPDRMLIQVFCGLPDEAYITSLLAELRRYFPDTPILGTTTAGEIVEGDQRENSTIVTVSQFDSTRCVTALETQNDDLLAAGRRLGNTLFVTDIAACIVFGCGIRDGGAINGEPLMQGLKEAGPHVVIAGAQAGDNGRVSGTFVFTEHGITGHGVAAAALYSTRLRVRNSYNLGWVPIGKRMTITHAEGARIHTIDDRPAAELYCHYLGDEIGAKLPASAADFPLVVVRDGVLMARHANRINPDGSLDYMSPFRVGEQVQFAFCHSGLLANQAVRTHADFAGGGWEGVFLYSCVSRKWVLGADIRIELADWPAIAPSAGFFSYGEYFHEAGKNYFLSQTLTILALSETSDDNARVADTPLDAPPYDSRQLQTLRVLHRLIETSSVEIEDMNKRLRELAHQDSLTGLANRRQLDAAADSELRRLWRDGKYLTCILLDVDHFKAFNDLYGHVRGDDCLRSVGLVLKGAMRRPGDLCARYGGEEFAVLLPDTDFAGGLQVAEAIRAGLENLHIPHERSTVAGVVTASLGIVTVRSNWHEDPAALFSLCDEQLYGAKGAGRNQVRGRELG